MNFYDLEAEKSVLSYALLTSETCAEACNSLNSGLFDDTRNSRIFEALKFYYQQFGGVLNKEGLQTLLNKNDVPQEKQVVYLTLFEDIKSKVTPKDQFVVSLDVLQDMKFKRGLFDLANAMAASLQKGSLDKSQICNDIVASTLSLQENSSVEVREMSYKNELKARQDDYLSRKNHPEKYRGIPYGIRKLDELTGGVLPQELSIAFGRPGSGKCLKNNTLISTSKGMIEIKEMMGHSTNKTFGPLSDDFTVPTHDAAAQKVFGGYVGGKEPIWRLTTGKGYNIEGTEEHSIFIREESGDFCFKKMKDIVNGDVVCLKMGGLWSSNNCILPAMGDYKYLGGSKNNHSYFPKKMTHGLARWLGYLTSEGHISDVGVSFCNSDEAVIDDFKKLTIGLFGCAVQTYIRINKRTGVKNWSVHVSRKSLVEFLRRLGIFGLSKDKVIPSCVLKSSVLCVQEFIRAYFEGDGHVGVSSLEVSSKSLSLLKTLQVVLLNLGIVSYRSKSRKCATNGTRIKRTYWRLYISKNYAIKYAEVVGFLDTGTKKAAWAARGLRRKQAMYYDTIPFVERDLRDLAYEVSCITGSVIPGQKKKGTGLCGLLGRKLGHSFFKRGWSHERIDALLKKTHKFSNLKSYKKLEEVNSLPYVYDRVVSVGPTGTQEYVFDLNVQESHSFVANGIITHNSSLVHNIAYHNAKLGNNVLLITIEMPKEQLGRRLDSRHLQISARGIRNASLNGDEEKKFLQSGADGAVKGDITIVDMPQGCSVSQILPVLRRHKMHGKVDALLIDYMNLMEPVKWSNSKVERTSDICKELKQLARLEKIPVITPARATREVVNVKEDDIGTEHLSWSDSAGYDADQVIYLKKGKTLNALASEVEAIVVKFRDGSNEKVNIGVDFDRSFFGDLEDVLQSVRTNLV